MIAIVNYGLGNLRSVEKALEGMGFPVKVTARADEILGAKGVILPGVGAFAISVKNLELLGLKDVVLEIINQGKPFLGICLGLQLLFTISEEEGVWTGLNVIQGRVVKLPSRVKIPHMGWNQINKKADSPIFEGVEDGSNFYFVHSYYVEPDDKSVITTMTDYGIEFASSIWKDNIFGVQFHPEKSGENGLRVLKNFAEVSLSK